MGGCSAKRALRVFGPAPPASFGGLRQHPKLLRTLVPILAHLVTKRQILAVADIQQLADYFGPLRVRAKGLASPLELPERLDKPPARPVPLQQPACQREFIDLDRKPVLGNQEISSDETRLVMTELLSWGRTAAIGCPGQKGFLQPSSRQRCCHLGSQETVAFPSEDFMEQWRKLSVMPMTPRLAT